MKCTNCCTCHTKRIPTRHLQHALQKLPSGEELTITSTTTCERLWTVAKRFGSYNEMGEKSSTPETPLNEAQGTCGILPCAPSKPGHKKSQKNWRKNCECAKKKSRKRIRIYNLCLLAIVSLFSHGPFLTEICQSFMLLSYGHTSDHSELGFVGASLHGILVTSFLPPLRSRRLCQFLQIGLHLWIRRSLPKMTAISGAPSFQSLLYMLR